MRVPERNGEATEGDSWLTADEAATYLRITRDALYARIARGQIQAHKLGGRLRFRRTDLDAALVPTSNP